ncbi:uncharacterized protein [Lolium perenne]|uniref:uncharacterized protein n=1 Tax=Lolium perenne TaxID=4522 RepID=UPI0021EA3BC2|nr:uncharacterized protein LOC127296956 [Lolium perenne]
MASDAGNSSSSPRSPCCSFPNFLLFLLNNALLALAAAALGPVLLLRPRPTPLGWALVSVHATTLLSALVSLYVLLARRHLCCCLPAHAALAVAALCGQALASYALFRCHDRSIALLGSARDRREQFVLVLLEEALLLGMFLVQAVALAVACAVGRRWAMEHEVTEAEKATAARKLTAPVQAEAGASAVDEKVNTSAGGKRVRWGNTDNC